MKAKQPKKSKIKFLSLLRFLLFQNSKKVITFLKLNKRKLNGIFFKYCLQLSVLYTLLYIFVYVLNYDIFSKSNEILEKTGSEFTYYFNAYPFNVWYLFLMWVFVNFYLFSVTLLILTLLNESKRPVKLLFSNSIYATSFIFVSCFPLLVLNTFYPINAETTIASFAFLVSLWILIIGVGIIISAIRFGNLGKFLLNQNYNRAIFSWVFSCFSLVFFIYKLLT
jgi:hypothetical protein